MAEAAYRAVKVTIWNDEKFFLLSDDGKLVWFHLYTNAHTNGLGLYQATIEGLAASLRWPLERYRKGFAEGLKSGLFEYDEMYQTIYFPKFIKHNKPANPNVMSNLLKSWDYIPNCMAKVRLHAALKGLGEGFAKRLTDINLTLPQTFGQTIPETGTVTVTGTGTVKTSPLPSTELSTKYVGDGPEWAAPEDAA